MLSAEAGRARLKAFCNKPALTVVVPMETKERLGLGGEHVLEARTKHLVPAGITLIDGRRIEEEELEGEYSLSTRKK